MSLLSFLSFCFLLFQEKRNQKPGINLVFTFNNIDLEDHVTSESFVKEEFEAQGVTV